MKKILSILFILISISCKTTIVQTKLPTPPETYNLKKIETQKDLIEAYRDSLMKIKEWQLWYNIQTNTIDKN